MDGWAERLIELYFKAGYSYKLILCFLVGLHGINISLRTLKRHLRRLGFKRRGSTDITSAFESIWVRNWQLCERNHDHMYCFRVN